MPPSIALDGRLYCRIIVVIRRSFFGTYLEHWTGAASSPAHAQKGTVGALNNANLSNVGGKNHVSIFCPDDDPATFVKALEALTDELVYSSQFLRNAIVEESAAQLAEKEFPEGNNAFDEHRTQLRTERLRWSDNVVGGFARVSTVSRALAVLTSKDGQ